MKNRKTLHNPENLSEILERIILLNEDSTAKWGRMDAPQMLLHCAKILDVATGKISLENPTSSFEKSGFSRSAKCGPSTTGFHQICLLLIM